jgi:hypothetical protein
MYADFRRIGVKLLEQPYYQQYIGPEVRTKMYPEYFN